MDRYHLPSTSWTPHVLTLAGQEGHHAVRVMRKKVGDQIEIFDGQGRWARGLIESAARTELVMRIAEEGRSTPATPQIEIAVAIPKGKTMDLIIQKAVELGANSIQPLVTRNTVVKIAANDDKLAKWQRVALEASKQCGQNQLPLIQPVKSFSDFLATTQSEFRIIASLAQGATSIRSHLEGLSSSEEQTVAILVGPEGDFTAAEVEEAVAAQFQPVTLGEIILRVETACLFLISAVRYRFS